MDMKTGWLFPTTTLVSILKARPLAMSLFERFQINPWNILNRGLAEACAAGGVPWEDFAEALNKLPIPHPDSDWKSLPSYHLLDFLTAEHREFLYKFIPAIGRALSEDVSDPDCMLRLRLLVSEWPSFVYALGDHIREEEDALYRRVLRYDSSLRLGWADPDFQGGSVRVFMTVRMLNHGHRDPRMMRTFIDRVMPTVLSHSEPCVLELTIRPLLTRFNAQLGNHARLESEILFPMAVDMEKKVYDQHITGVTRTSPSVAGIQRSNPFSAFSAV